ncbi:MAG TPA: universal stress protein [Bacteroidetes bacterium]|nr:universal stress protein [Bacteroidota bacterium]
MIKSILLSVDNSLYTESVVRNGMHLAGIFQARLHVLSVVDARTYDWQLSAGANAFVPVIPSTIYLEETRRLEQEKSRAVLEKCRSMLEEAGVEYTINSIAGSPIDVIVEKARTCDLVIMGTQGEMSAWQSRTIGETLEAVSRQVRRPILVVDKTFQPFERLLAAYDGSAGSEKALTLAGFFASKLGCPLMVIVVSSRKKEAERILREAENYLAGYHIPVETDIISGSPDTAICSYAEKKGADLIVIGAYGRSRLAEALSGSNTEAIVRKAKMPVLLVK